MSRTLLFVNPWSGIIGPNVGMAQYAAEALGRGHQVHVVAPLRDDFSVRLEQQSAQVHYWPDLDLTRRWSAPLPLAQHLLRSWKVASRIGNLARRVGADVLCVNGENVLLAPRAGRVARRPVVVVIRGIRFVEIGTVARVYFSIQQRWVRRYLAVSETVKQGLERLGVPPASIVVVPNGVDTSQFDDRPSDPGLARSLGIPDRSIVVGSIGHLERIKGFHHLIEAFSSIAGHFPDAVCLLVGGTDDPNAAAYGVALRARVAELGLQRKVIFTGYRTDVADLVNLMHIVVHPSESESFGRSIAEAMASGRPVIGFAVGAVPELIADGETGFVIPPFDIAALAGAIGQLLGDESQCRRMGRAARERVRARYDLKRNVAATIDLLEGIADDGRRQT